MILSINTSTPQFSIALLEEGGTLLAEYFMAPGSKHFNGFMPALDWILTRSGRGLKDLRALIVAKGPGSFTGLRVGLSAAKGLCQSLDVPIIGVSGLEAMAAQIPFAGLPLCPVIESRKGEVFAALFRWSRDRELVRIKDDTGLRFADIKDFVGEKCLLVGNDFNAQGPVIAGLLGQMGVLVPPAFWALKASAVAYTGLGRYQSGDFDALRDLVPSYLRPPDIRPNPFPPAG